MAIEPIIEVQNLCVEFNDSLSQTRIVNDVSFTLHPATMLAVVGASGSGKTTMCRAMTRLFSRSLHATVSGKVLFKGIDLLQSDDERLRAIRRTELRYVFQEPQQAMNPVLTVRRQMKLAAGHVSIADHQLDAQLNLVGITNAAEVLASYPHQLSIGIAQRVQIAMAVLPSPALIIADEPTSAVDATMRFHLLDLLRKLQQTTQTTMIIITHDLDVARDYSGEIAIMQNGQLIEHTKSSAFFRNPKSDHGRMLLEATGGTVGSAI